jgi:hypothetical protein
MGNRLIVLVVARFWFLFTFKGDCKMSNANASVGHNWFHSSKREGKSSNGNLFYSGDVAYSYGRHFPIAHKLEVNGQTVVLFNSERSSVTTEGKHKNAIRRAIPHSVPVFYVPNLGTELDNDSHKENWQSLVKAYQSLLQSAERSRKYKSGMLARAEETREEANAYRALFLSDDPTCVDIEQPEDVATQIAEWQRIEREQEERERQAKAAEEAERLERWLQGEHVGTLYHSDIAFRLSPSDSETIETTRGASFPLSHGKKALNVLLRLRARGEAYQRKQDQSPIRLGNYSIDSVDNAGNVVAGCHEVRWEAIERFARTLGLL